MKLLVQAKQSTHLMRYIIVIIASAGVVLMNISLDDRFLPPLPYSMLEHMWYSMAVIQCPIPAAILAERVSPKRLMIAIMTLKFISMALLQSYRFESGVATGAIVGKILQGSVAAAYPPIMYVFIARWSPPKERSHFASIIFSGIPIGEMLTTIVFSYYSYVKKFCPTNIFGALMLFWVMLWSFVEDTPTAQKVLISEREKKYILACQQIEESELPKKQPPFPFRGVLTSGPFWVLLGIHCGAEAGVTVLKFLPKDLLLTWSFYGVSMSSMHLIGALMTLLQHMNKISINQARQIATICALLPVAIALLVMVMPVNENVLYIFRILGIVFYGAVYSGFMINHIDLSPKFAATLLSITTTVATIVSIVVTYFMVFGFQKIKESPNGWIYATAIISLFTITMTLYLCFGSGEVQPWNTNPKRCGSKDGDPGPKTLESATV